MKFTFFMAILEAFAHDAWVLQHVQANNIKIMQGCFYISIGFSQRGAGEILRHVVSPA